MKNLETKVTTFYWTGMNSTHQTINGVIQANNIKLAKLNLIKQGIIILDIYKKKTLLFKLTKKISRLDITIFFHQLVSLISAGIPIVQSCELLSQSQENQSFRKIIQSIKVNLETGKQFAVCLRQFPEYFDELTCHLVHTGEQTGTFCNMLKRITIHHEKIYLFKNKLKQALFYPMIISIISIIVTLVILIMIVPRFAELFSSMQQPLPLFTLIIIKFSQLIRSYGWVCICLLGFYFIIRSQFPKISAGRFLLKICLPKLPVFNVLIHKMKLVQWLRTLCMSLSAGVPIIETLKIMTYTNDKALDNSILRELQTQILKGEQLHSAMQKNPLFPIMLVQMVKIGEESGMLEHMLEKIAELYENDIAQLTTNLSHLLEPLIMVILGVLIGILVIAMYLPIFKLGTML